MSYDLEGELKKIAWFLPNQAPIKDFIHQNILMAFLDIPFEEALVKASKLYKARAYMDLSYYRENFEQNKITPKDLHESLDYFLPKELESEREFIYYALFNYKEIKNYQTFLFLSRNTNTQILEKIQALEEEPRIHAPKISDLITKQVGESFEHEINQLLFRLLGSYLDQGVSLWPHLDQWPSFQSAVCEEAKESVLPLAPFVKNQELNNWLKLSPEKIIPQILAKLVVEIDLFTAYIQESLFAHPGWSGMIKILTIRPDTLTKPCNINLPQLLAVKLALQLQYIENKQNKKNIFRPISKSDLAQARAKTHKEFSSNCLSLAYLISSMPKNFLITNQKLYSILNMLFLQKIWHRAMERNYYNKLFSLFKNKSLRNNNREKTFQVIFCVDDRECSFRRLLERESSNIETFGTAGFFGIDCYFQPKNLAVQKMCPTNLSPKHIITESENYTKNTRRQSLYELALFMSRHGANSTFLGLVSAYTIGHLSLFSLLFSMLHPIKLFRSKRLALRAGLGRLEFEQKEEKTREDGLVLGYTHDEMADRVFGTLNSMGMKNFSRLVFLLGHGSSSVNNPHFSAYDCQACSGHPGAVNARIFAAMANLKPVREILRKKNMIIPEDTIFIGGFHDTCTDAIIFFELENLNPTHKALFEQFMKHLNKVREKNAQERCQKFALVPAAISGPKALREVEHRAHALFEPRPELGHARNALAVVSRRERTSDIDFDRRAFLQTYNPTSDPTGQILDGILSAVIPVCGHINLDYYFSRLDPAVYGAGTKLSHNVCSLIGVGNGLDDDLRTGLPIQMTELHDPLRLLIIIEQHEEIILETVSKNIGIFPWIKNEWVRIASLDPSADRLSMFEPSTNSFVEVM